METEMLDLNADVVFSADLRFTDTPDSLTSTTTSSTINAAAADEVDCDSSMGKGDSVRTINFSILDKNAIEIEDAAAAGSPNELHLFPMVVPPPSSAAVRTKYCLDLSVPENSIGGRVELGVSLAQLQANNQAPPQQPQVKKSRRGPRSRSSQYRGVTFYRRTGRWESHIWDSGKQVYLGGFDTAHDAARAYDRAAIKFRGVDADINFAVGDYQEDMEQMKNLAKEEFVRILRRQSNGFSRGNSKYRGGTLHKCGRLEARMGQFLGQKGYDKAAVKCNGLEAVSNFEASNYANGGGQSSLDLSLGISLSGGENDHRTFVTGRILQDRAAGTDSVPGFLPTWEWKIPNVVMSSSSSFAASSGFSSSPSIPQYLHRA